MIVFYTFPIFKRQFQARRYLYTNYYFVRLSSVRYDSLIRYGQADLSGHQGRSSQQTRPEQQSEQGRNRVQLRIKGPVQRQYKTIFRRQNLLVEIIPENQLFHTSECNQFVRLKSEPMEWSVCLIDELLPVPPQQCTSELYSAVPLQSTMYLQKCAYFKFKGLVTNWTLKDNNN